MVPTRALPSANILRKGVTGKILENKELSWADIGRDGVAVLRVGLNVTADFGPTVPV